MAYVPFATPRRATHRAPAFTLIELLVVIGIIALLIGILLPSLGRSQEMGRRTACLANLRSIGQALVMYANQNRDRLPNGNPRNTSLDFDGTNLVLVVLASEYVSGVAKVFHCPSDRDPVPDVIDNAVVGFPNSARVSYDFYSPYWQPEFGPKLARLRGEAPLAWEISGGDANRDLKNHPVDGGHVLFADASVDLLPNGQWSKSNWPRLAGVYYHR